jgi:hypothetical protein
VFDTADTRLVPLVGAFVAVVDSSAADLARRQRARSVAATDTAGEFRLRLPPGRMSVLEVKAVGYARALVAVDGAWERAVVLMLALGSGRPTSRTAGSTCSRAAGRPLVRRDT